MKVAFYKGKRRLFNRFVSWYLHGEFSHVELVLYTVGHEAMCVSSSFMDGGVRKKLINLNNPNWVVVEVKGYSVNHMTTWLRDNMGKPYDWIGLFGFVWRRNRGMAKHWFCSEAVAAMLNFDEPWRFDPMDLYQILTRESGFFYD